MLLHHLFIENVKKGPKDIAVIEQATDKEVTYENLLVASLIFRKIFAKYPNKFIGIMIPPAPGCIIAFLGAMMAGKTPVIINYSTGALENCKYAQKKCGFRTIITSRKLLEKLQIQPIKGMVFMEDLAAKITLLQKVKAKLQTKLSATLIKKLVAGGNVNDTVCILFTTGSEKDPKAVQLSHKNIHHNIVALTQHLDLRREQTHITNLPYFHVFGFTINLWVPLGLGAKIITVPNPLEYKLIVESVRKHKVSILAATPTFAWGYLQKAQRGDFEAVRYFIVGADKLPIQLYEECKKNHGIELIEGYGCTETSPVIAVNRPGENKIGSVGKPIPGVRVKITNLETGEEVPRGEVGKILVKGDLVMKGYFNDIEETSLRIRDGYYDTGDMGIHDEEGYLHHRGRLRRFVKIAGEMVSLVKVEEEINKLLPAGVICCVVDTPDIKKGSEIVAVVTTKEIDQKAIKKKLGKILPNIAIPKKFNIMPELPMMASGKVNFRAVEEVCRNNELEDF